MKILNLDMFLKIGNGKTSLMSNYSLVGFLWLVPLLNEVYQFQ